MRKFVIAIMTLVTASLTAPTFAVNEAEFLSWVSDTTGPTPTLAPAQELGTAEIGQLGAVLPPGYRKMFGFPAAHMVIQGSGDYRPHQAYLDASEKHAGSATIGADGSISGHVAGQPFSIAQIEAADARTGGYMAAWNSVFRWQYYGYRSKPLTMYYVRLGSPAVSGERPAGIGGEAPIERSVEMWFHRAYLSRLAMLADSNYTMDVSGGGKALYKDFMEITAPFDVAGAKFIIERSLDPYEEDQVNSYLPTERRVRRLSAQERADSFMGSEYTFDDFEGFSGRVMDYEWTLAGRHTILAVADSMHERIAVGGPDSIAPEDRWQLRDCFIVKMVPRWDGHPYGAKYVFIDTQTWLVHLAVVFNRAGELLKTIDPIWQYPERDGLDATPGNSVARWIGTIGVDYVKGTASVSQALKTDIPTMKPASVKRLFNVSALTDGR